MLSHARNRKRREYYTSVAQQGLPFSPVIQQYQYFVGLWRVLV